MNIDRSLMLQIQQSWRKCSKILLVAIATMTILLASERLNLANATKIDSAQPAKIGSKTLKVATRVVSPFVTAENGELGGFSIELWKNIATELKLESEYIRTNNVSELLDRVRSKQADLAIAAISVTAQREQDFDFSQPIFDSGLQILVRSQEIKNSLWRLLSLIFTPTLFQLLGIMLLVILIPAHIVWLVERNHQGGFLENNAYFPGIFKACWWAAATLATQAEEMPKGAIGRIMAVIWMFISVVFIAYFTATVTTSLTVDQLQSNIKGVSDLPGKKIATVTGSTSANYLQQEHLDAQQFPQITEAYQALNNGAVDAVVYDAPILLYYAAHEGKGDVRVVGNIFRRESYAIALPNISPYRKSINQALLSLQEKGIYQEIYDKWFTSK